MQFGLRCTYTIERLFVLQINRSPSFGTDEKLDYEIKSALVLDSVKLMNIR